MSRLFETIVLLLLPVRAWSLGLRVRQVRADRPGRREEKDWRTWRTALAGEVRALVVVRAREGRWDSCGRLEIPRAP